MASPASGVQPAAHLTDHVLPRVPVRRWVLSWLACHGSLDEEAVATMLAWRHRGGFSLDASVRLGAWDRPGVERLATPCGFWPS